MPAPCDGLRLQLRKVLSDEDKNPADADRIIMKHTGLDKGALLNSTYIVTDEQFNAIECDIAARLSGRPLQYILGEWEFYSLPFIVGEGVLVPRPETELLVDFALDFLRDKESPVVYDLCSGSGCIAAAVGKNRPNARVFALEWSEAALGYLTENIKLNSTANVSVLKADVLAGPSFTNLPAPDLILSNPPYIPSADMAHLMDEVLCEPEMALLGGADGLDFYRALATLWLPCLQTGGGAAFEVGLGQADDVGNLVSQAGYDFAFIHDLSGIERVVTATKSDIKD